MKQKLFFIIVILFASQNLFSQPSTFLPRGIGGGGAMFFPSINPADENEFYVSCDMSEMFHSTNFGLNYTQIDFQKLQTANTSTYEFTSFPNVAYTSFNDGNTIFPVVTNDGGVNWTPMAGYNVGTFGSVYSVKANYNNPSQVVVGAYGDILFSTDYGATFNLVKHATNMGAGIIISGIYWDGLQIYIATNEGILHSSDGGVSFSIMNTVGISTGEVIWSFASANNGMHQRFVCITANSSDVYNGVMPWNYSNFAKGVYVMNDIDSTWLARSIGINFSSDFVMYSAMSATDITTIYLGGHDNNLGAPLVYKSSTGGDVWSKKFNTTNNQNIITGWEGSGGDKNWSWSETCFGISVAPNNSNKVLFGNYSNIQASDDGGDNWRQAYVNSSDQHVAGSITPQHLSYRSIGLENTTCWQVAWADANKMMGCFSDIGGIRSVDGGNSWGFQYTGFSANSVYRIEKSLSGKLFGACSNIHDMYQSTRLSDAQLDAADANGKIVFSNDSGLTWTTLHTFGHPVFWLAIDPSNQNTMYASVIHYGGTQGSQLGGIYKTNDLNNLSSSTWTKLPNPPRTEGHPASINILNDGKVVCTFSGRRSSLGFTASSGVFIYDPTLNSWSDVSDNGMKYWTKDIVIDPSDVLQNTWYACVFSGWGGAANGLGGLYKTTNRGLNWIKLTGAPFDRVTSITFNPSNNNQAFLTTETQGLWFSSTMNSMTPTWSLVTSYPFRQPERVFFNPYNQSEVWVSSFGNGMKVGNMVVNEIVDFTNGEKEKLELYPNPSSGDFTISISEKTLQLCPTLTINNLLGEEVYKIKTNNIHQNVIGQNLSAGIYICKLLVNDKCVATRKLIIAKK